MKCPKCGEIECGLLDGYLVGDTLLEGVMFEIRNINGKPDVKVEDESKEYFEELNSKKWLDAVKYSLKDMDSLTCPKCKSDIENPFYKEPSEKIKPKKIAVLNGTQFVKNIIENSTSRMPVKKLDHNQNIGNMITKPLLGYNSHRFILLADGNSFCITCFLKQIKCEIKDKVNFHRTCDKPKNMCLGDISMAIDDAFNKINGGND
jgi:uncharacterized protein (UPF0212 family)